LGWFGIDSSVPPDTLVVVFLVFIVSEVSIPGSRLTYHRCKAKPSSDEVALPAHSYKHKHGKQSKFNPKVTCFGCSRIGRMIGDCRDVKSLKTFTKAQKEQNTRKSKE
jgi:hypothetical protein